MSRSMWSSPFVDSSSVCMQHTILVTGVVSCALTIIGVLFGAYKWYHWFPLATAFIVLFAAIPAAQYLTVNLLVTFAVVDGLDFILKVFNIGSLIYYKVKISEDCSPFDLAGNEEECPDTNWRLLLLNITNAIVFYIFSAVIEITLFTFSIYLIYSVRKYRPFYEDSTTSDSFQLSNESKVSGISNI